MKYLKETSIIKKYEKLPLSVKASLWYIICSMLQKGIAFLTTPIFTRMMSTKQYGQVTIYNSWLEIFTIFATLNLFYGVYNNALTKYPDDKDIVTSSMQGFCTSLTIGLFILYYVLHSWFNKLTGLSTFMTCMLFIEILFIPAFRFWATKQRFEYKYRTLIILSLLISLLTPLLGIPAVILSTEKGIAKILTSVLIQTLIGIVLYRVIFKNGKIFYKRNYWKYALVFNLPLIPHYLSSTILNQCDRIMIASMCGADKAGIYGLAYTIGALAIIFNEAIMNSYTPYTYQHLKKKSYESIKKNSRYLVTFIAVVVIIIVTLAPEVIWILGGEKYNEGIWVIAPIAASIFFRFLYGLYGNIEFYFEENYFIMIASVLCALLNIITNYIFIKICGYLAAGYTTLGCFAIYAFAHYFFSEHLRKKHGVDKEIYDSKYNFLLGVIVMLFCFGAMALYRFTIIRYLFITAIIICITTFREKIIHIIRLLRKKV